MPIRIQRKRTKGWRMPENTVYVGRPSAWANPFTDLEGAVWHRYSWFGIETTEFDSVDLYQAWITGRFDYRAHLSESDFREQIIKSMADQARELRGELHTLRGKNLACWCGPQARCHADVLLKLANAEAIRNGWKRSCQERLALSKS